MRMSNGSNGRPAEPKLRKASSGDNVATCEAVARLVSLNHRDI